MSSVWVVPASTDSHGQEGDALVRASGDEVEVGRVTGSGVEWLGTVPAGTIELPEVTEPTAAPQLETAVRGVQSALTSRGG